MKTVLILSSTRCLRQTGTSTCFFPYWDVQILQMKKKDWFTLCNFCGVHQDSPLISYIIISYCKNKTWPLQKIWEIQENRRKVNFSMFMAPRNNCCYILVELSSLHFCFIRKNKNKIVIVLGMQKSVLFFFFFQQKEVYCRSEQGEQGQQGVGVGSSSKNPQLPEGLYKAFFFFKLEDNCFIILCCKVCSTCLYKPFYSVYKAYALQICLENRESIKQKIKKSSRILLFRDEF